MSGSRHSSFASLSPLPAFWTEEKTASGLVYYRNSETKANSWDRPIAKRVPVPTVAQEQPYVQAFANNEFLPAQSPGLDGFNRPQLSPLPSPAINGTNRLFGASSPISIGNGGPYSPVASLSSLDINGAIRSQMTPLSPFAPSSATTSRSTSTSSIPHLYKDPSTATMAVAPAISQMTPRAQTPVSLPNRGPPVNRLLKPKIHVSRPVDQSEVGIKKVVGREYIIGIDFGTTFSSSCYYARDSADAPFRRDGVQQVVQWGNGQGTLENLPSQLLYEGQRVVSWGNIPEEEVAVNPNALLVKWFKLHLKTSSELISGSYNKGLQSSRSSYPLPAGLKVRQVITDYLRRLRNAILESLIQLKTSLVGYSVCYVLTVPAIWNPREKAAMRQSAVDAGYLDTERGLSSAKLHFVTEPEAAAFGIWSAAEMENPQVGETFLVCDAGGGTVDLITYIVKQSKPTIVFEELVGPSGGLCGSSYLDTRFENLLRSILTIHADALLGTRRSQSSAQKAYLNKFTGAFNAYKQTFGCGADQRDFLSTADTTGRESMLKDLNMSNGLLRITSDQIKDVIFSPVIDQIKALVNEQLDRAAIVGHSNIDFVYLVGGFGNSPFLYTSLESMFSSQRTRVVSVPRSQLTISKGAVMSRLASYDSGPLGPLAGRRLSHSFAHEFDSTSFEGVDLTDRLMSHNRAGIPILTGNLDYLANKGELYSERETFQSDEVFRYILQEDEFNSWSWTRSKQLYSCASYERPVWRGQPGTGALGDFCTLTFSSTDIPQHQAEFFATSGSIQAHAKLIFRLRMAIAEEVLTFSLIFGNQDEISISEAIYTDHHGLEAE